MKTCVWLVAGVTWLIFGAVMSAADAAAAAPSPQTFELNRGVIVDPVRGVVYLMNPSHGIDAIDLASGKLLWRTAAAAKPLALFDHRLVAQAETSGGARALSIVVLNTMARGEQVLSATVPLAAPAFAAIDTGMATSFEADARLSGGALEVSWRFTQQAVSGRPGPPLMTELSGEARIDLKTGRVAPMASGSAPTPRSIARGAPADIKLPPGFNLSIASADGQTMLANKPAGADATGWMDYVWAIYSLKTREKLAEIRMPTSAAPFFVWNSMLIYESRPYGRRINGTWVDEPRAVRAVDINSGIEAWKAPVRDTTYHGPFPPRP